MEAEGPNWKALAHITLLNIFHYFPWKHRFSLELVCKQWRELMPYDDLDVSCLGEAQAQKVVNWLTAKQFKHPKLRVVELVNVADGIGQLSDQLGQRLATFTTTASLKLTCTSTAAKLLYLPMIGAHQLENLTELTLSLDQNPAHDWLVPLHVSDSVKNIAMYAPRLRALTLNGGKQAWYPDPLPASLKTLIVRNAELSDVQSLLVPLTDLGSLEFDGCTVNSSVTLPLLPQLTTLRLKTFYHQGQKWKLVFQHLATTCPNLSNLECEHGIIYACPSSAMEKLRTLHLNMCDCKALCQFLTMCNPNMENLTLAGVACGNNEIFSVISGRFHALKHLAIKIADFFDGSALKMLFNGCTNLRDVLLWRDSLSAKMVYSPLAYAPPSLREFTVKSIQRIEALEPLIQELEMLQGVNAQLRCKRPCVLRGFWPFDSVLADKLAKYGFNISNGNNKAVNSMH